MHQYMWNNVLLSMTQFHCHFLSLKVGLTSLYHIRVIFCYRAIFRRKSERGLLLLTLFLFYILFQRTVTDTYKGKKYVLMIHT